MIIKIKNISGEVYFIPPRDCAETIVNEIRQAKSEIYVQVYYFTSVPNLRNWTKHKNHSDLYSGREFRC
jgi:hypothetical protein